MAGGGIALKATLQNQTLYLGDFFALAATWHFRH
ncbi:unnamed protein product, partial [marine sediment metagenome]